MKKYHHCVKFTYPLSFQTRIPKVDQHTGGKWLIHGTKHRKDNQLQSLELHDQSTKRVPGMPHHNYPGWLYDIIDVEKVMISLRNISEANARQFM